MENDKKRAKEITITKDVYCTRRRTYFQEDTEESPDNFMAPRIGVIKSAWIFLLKYFEVILLQRYGSANLARKNIYNLAITFNNLLLPLWNVGFTVFFGICREHLFQSICSLNRFY